MLASAAQQQQQQKGKSTSASPGGTPTKGSKKKNVPGVSTPKSGTNTPKIGQSSTQQSLDIAGLRLDADDVETYTDKDVPKAALARAQLLEEVRTAFDNETGTKALSVVVVGPFLTAPIAGIALR